MTSRRPFYHVLSLVWIILILVGLGFYLLVTHRYTYRIVAESSSNEAKILSQSLDAALRRVQAVSIWAEQLVGEEGRPTRYSAILRRI